MPILSIIILFSLIISLVIFCIPCRYIKIAKIVALCASIILLGLNGFMLVEFNPQIGLNQFELVVNPMINHFQFHESYNLGEHGGFDFNLGVDSISLLMINLMSLVGFLTMLYLLVSDTMAIKELICLIWVLQSFVIASFATLNILFFYIFFEIALVPMYFIIGYWGGENRVYASYKFFLYTLFASLIFIICIVYLFTVTNTFNMRTLYQIGPQLDIKVQQLLWIAIFISFAIKVPMIPFHTWLPDVHVQAPTVGSVILAAVLLKIGGYGFLRILLPILPYASAQFAIYPMILSVIAIIYASFAAMAQKDMKKMIAYSSIAHMGYVNIGIFSFSGLGISGGIFQMVSHGLVSSMLFFIVGCLYDRVQSRQIASYAGIAKVMPMLSSFFMIAVLASIGMPGTSGFIAEFLCFNGLYANGYIIISSLSVAGILLSAIYMLGLYKNVVFGVIQNQKIHTIVELNFAEKIVLAVLAILIILFGIAPNYLNNIIAPYAEILFHKLIDYIWKWRSISD